MHEIDIARTPMLRLSTVVIQRHEIAWMRIILSQRNHHYMRRVTREIPRLRLTKFRIVRTAIPNAFHAEIVRCVKPANTVDEAGSALRY